MEDLSKLAPEEAGKVLEISMRIYNMMYYCIEMLPAEKAEEESKKSNWSNYRNDDSNYNSNNWILD